jgi:glycosyltransferase family protein
MNILKNIKSILRYYDLKNFIKLRYYQLNAKKHISIMPCIYNEIMTLKEVAQKKCSVARYGDGEIAICLGEGIRFQEYNADLAQRLREILKNDSLENLFVCIAPHVNSSYILTSRVNAFVYKFISRRGYQYLKLLKSGKKYGSAYISRPDAFEFKNEELEQYRCLLRKLWDNRDVLIVTGKGSRFELIPDLFDNIKSAEFIYSLSKNAFSQYDELLSKVNSYSKDKLILIALGPTATVLAYDLAKKGYQAIDIGHLPSCYEVVKNGNMPSKLGY